MRIFNQDMTCVKIFFGTSPVNFTVEKIGGKYGIAMHDTDGSEIMAKYYSEEKAQCLCNSVKNFCADTSTSDKNFFFPLF